MAQFLHTFAWLQLDQKERRPWNAKPIVVFNFANKQITYKMRLHWVGAPFYLRLGEEKSMQYFLPQPAHNIFGGIYVNAILNSRMQLSGVCLNFFNRKNATAERTQIVLLQSICFYIILSAVVHCRNVYNQWECCAYILGRAFACCLQTIWVVSNIEIYKHSWLRSHPTKAKGEHVCFKSSPASSRQAATYFLNCKF